MKHEMFAGVAAAAVLAMFAQVPVADAGPFKRAGATAAQAGKLAPARRGLQQPGNLSGAGRQRTGAVNPATLLGLAILYRKCLDNILPECPK